MDDKNINKELELTKQKAQEYLDGWKRARADYSNFKKDNEKRQQEVIQFANATLVSEMIPIFNNFKLALKHIPKDQQEVEWVQGFSHIKKQFEDFLRNFGIEEIKTVGEKFNPEFHEALVHEENEDFETDVVFEEVKSGYTLHGKVINPAQVKVTK